MQHYQVRRPTAARPPPHHQAGFNFLDSIQVHLTQTGLPFKKGVLKVFAQYKKGSNKPLNVLVFGGFMQCISISDFLISTNTVLKKSIIPDSIIEFHRRCQPILKNLLRTLTVVSYDG
ncbi:hypothetical protein ACJW31_03G163200 [Castanea mollissima]